MGVKVGLRRLAVCAIGIAALGCGLASPTQARTIDYWLDNAPACDPATPSSVLPNLPATLAFGRRLDAESGAYRENPVPDQGALRDNPATERWWFEYDMTLRAADPAQPISHPFGPIEDPYAPDIRFERGDGTALVVWRVVEHTRGFDGGGYCHRQLSQTVAPIEGVAPGFRAWREEGRVKVMARSCRQLSQTARGPATVTFRSGKRRKSLPLSGDACDIDALRGSVSTNGRGGWTLRRSLTGIFSFRPGFERKGKRRVRFKVRFEDQLRLRGSFQVKTTTIGGTRIREGTDSFINVCINGPYPIHSANGHLYCIIPGSTDHAIRRWRVREVG